MSISSSLNKLSKRMSHPERMVKRILTFRGLHVYTFYLETNDSWSLQWYIGISLWHKESLQAAIEIGIHTPVRHFLQLLNSRNVWMQIVFISSSISKLLLIKVSIYRGIFDLRSSNSKFYFCGLYGIKWQNGILRPIS